MDGAPSVSGTLADIAPSRRARFSRWFYPALSGALLTAVFIGFAPSFYLRPLFTERPLPGYLYVHGAVLTTWFLLVLVQTCLVAARRTQLHRRLGIAAAVVAGLLVSISAFVALRAISRYIAAGVDPAEIQFIVLGDLASLAVFTTLLVAALQMRSRPDWHRRLMAVACIIIIGPAIARLAHVGFTIPVPAVLVLLLGLQVGHDIVTLRRLHRATVLGSLLVIIALGAVLSVVGTATGQAIVDALRTTP